MTDWKPGADLEALRVRAQLMASIRRFFAVRQVLEVDTPSLAATTATDVYIESFGVEAPKSVFTGRRYLQTSPEFAMKRLLASGSGPIYQLGKVFRAEQRSKRHNPEFTLLEWYRPGYTLTELMDEVAALITELLGAVAIARCSYRELFLQHLQIDPHRIALAELRERARARIEFSSDDLTATDYLQMLLARFIEPELPQYCFIYDYPEAQAALSRVEIDALGDRVARRFELFGRGMELANGYDELTEADEQRRRFLADNARRAALGLPQYPVDEKLLAALASGLPACAGVALGVDRVLMLRLGVDDIQQTISFVTD